MFQYIITFERCGNQIHIPGIPEGHNFLDVAIRVARNMYMAGFATHVCVYNADTGEVVYHEDDFDFYLAE